MFNINFNMVCKILLQTLFKRNFFSFFSVYFLYHVCVCVCEEKFIHLEKWLLRHQGTVYTFTCFLFLHGFFTSLFRRKFQITSFFSLSSSAFWFTQKRHSFPLTNSKEKEKEIKKMKRGIKDYFYFLVL